MKTNNKMAKKKISQRDIKKFLRLKRIVLHPTLELNKKDNETLFYLSKKYLNKKTVDNLSNYTPVEIIRQIDNKYKIYLKGGNK